MAIDNLIGVSCQIDPPDFARVIRVGQPRAVLLMPPFANVDAALFVQLWSPHSKMIIRWNGAQTADENYTRPPEVWCAPAYEFFAPFRDAGVLDAVVLLNEPQIDADTRAQEIENAKRLNDWHVGAAAYFTARNIHCGAYSFSRGTPKTRKHNGDLETWSYLRDGAAACSYLFVHEYTYPRYGDGIDFWEHRYRALWNELPVWARRPIGITECLHDGGGIPGGLQGELPGGGGWLAEQYNLPPDAVIADLKRYATALTLDNINPDAPLVDFATPFIYGAAGNFAAFDLGNGAIREQFISEFLPWAPLVRPFPPVNPPMPPPRSWSPSPSPSPEPPPTGGEMFDKAQFVAAVHAFDREAYRLRIGAPYTPELDYDQNEPDGTQTPMRYRVYQHGALVCEIGDWGNIQWRDPLTGEQIIDNPTPPPPAASASPSPSQGAPPPPGVTELPFGLKVIPYAPHEGEWFWRLVQAGGFKIDVGLQVIVTCRAEGATKFGVPVINAWVQPVGGADLPRFEQVETNGAGQAEFIFGAGSKFDPPADPPNRIYMSSGDGVDGAQWPTVRGDVVQYGLPNQRHLEGAFTFEWVQA